MKQIKNKKFATIALIIGIITIMISSFLFYAVANREKIVNMNGGELVDNNYYDDVSIIFSESYNPYNNCNEATPFDVGDYKKGGYCLRDYTTLNTYSKFHYMGDLFKNSKILDGYNVNINTSKINEYIDQLRYIFDIIPRPFTDTIESENNEEWAFYRQKIFNELGADIDISKIDGAGETSYNVFRAQQYAIWYFTNADQYIDFKGALNENSKQYKYFEALVDKANEKAKSGYTVNPDAIITLEKADDCKVQNDGSIGPFIINNENKLFNQLTVTDGTNATWTILDEAGNQINNYNTYNGKIYVKSNEAIDVNDYNVDVKVSCKYYKSTANVWGDNWQQPILTITRTKEGAGIPFSSEYKAKVDLALKKQISAINDESIDGNIRSAIDIKDIDKVKNGATTNLIYNMKKKPVNVKIGDKVTYDINIYNEGTEIDGYATEITDFLPKGTIFDINSNQNKQNGWKLYDEDGNEITGWTESSFDQNELKRVSYIKSNALKDTVITKLEDESTVPDYKTVKVDVIISNEAEGTLTNAAAITVYGYKNANNELVTADSGTKGKIDVDSDSDFDSSKIDENYWGGEKTDLDENEPANYPGQEDDDDFEKVFVQNEVDLALKKSIYEIEKTDGTHKSSNRNINVNTYDSLEKGEKTAFYYLPKNDLTVEEEDIVTYQIVIANEGNVDATASEIIDYLPEGLEFLKDDPENKEYGWYTENGNDRIVKTNYLRDSFIDKYLVNTNDSLESRAVYIRCKVKKNVASENSVRLVNIAEISKYQVNRGNYTEELTEDRDSQTTDGGKVKLPTESEWPNYHPDPENLDVYPNEDDSETLYPVLGQQDDDDFDAVIVSKQKKFDLALRKYISAVNDERIPQTREPRPQTTVFTDEVTTANYNHPKKAVEVYAGDTVTYTIRVYNEGELDGKATEITDYLPDGLEFLSSEVDGVDYGWKTVEGNSKAIYTDYLEDKENLKANSYKTARHEVKVKCKVSDSVAFNTYLTNRAEITAHVDEKGNEYGKKYGITDEASKLDIDSKPDSISSSLNLSNWYNTKYSDVKYIPGEQDDDDFETVFVKSTKDAEVKLYKVNQENFEKLKNNQISFEQVPVLSGAKFDVSIDDGEKTEFLSENANKTIASFSKLKAGELHRIQIDETQVPNGYAKDDFNSFIISLRIKQDMTIDVRSNDNSKYVTLSDDGKTVYVAFVNKPKEFDLALRKFITNVERDGRSVYSSEVMFERNPELNIFSLINYRSGTAGYYHTKDAVAVRKNDIVTYTIRVYNEGFIKGYVTKVADYLPSGLELINDSLNTENEWSTPESLGNGVTKIESTKLQNTLLNECGIVDYINNKSGIPQWYADIQVKCRVTGDAENGVEYLTNRAEITERKAVSVNGTTETVLNIQDRDNTTEINNSLNLDNHYVENVINQPKKDYYPGSEDDDDFETLCIRPYIFILNKVDEKETPLNDARFTVNYSVYNQENNTLLDNEVVNGTYTYNNGRADLYKSFTYDVKENSSKEGYLNILGDNTIHIVVHMDEHNNIIPGYYEDYFDVPESRYFEKYNYVLANKDGLMVKDTETDLYGRISVEINNDKDIPEIVVTVENQKEPEKIFDLALRKYIKSVKRNGEEVYSNELYNKRVPSFDWGSNISLLKNGTATYNHPKYALTVEQGDIVTYGIRVYNEGNVEGKVTEITDYLPQGLEYYTSSTKNSNYDWRVTLGEGGRQVLTTDNLKDTVLEANQLSDQLTGKATNVWYSDVEVECRVVASSESELKYLINRAEITGRKAVSTNGNNETVLDLQDRDNETEIKNTLNLDNHYVENVLNKRMQAYYPGSEDDDDFETIRLNKITDFKLDLFKGNYLERNDSSRQGLDIPVEFTVEEIKPDVDVNAITNSDVISSKTITITGEGNLLENTKAKLNTSYRYRIMENEVGNAFQKTVRQVIVKVNVDSEGRISSQIEKLNDSIYNSSLSEIAYLMPTNDEKLIKIGLENRPISEYRVLLEKVDENGNVIKNNPASFRIVDGYSVNSKPISTDSEGQIIVKNSKVIYSENQSDTYQIEEAIAPDGYGIYNGSVILNVKTKVENGKYVLDQDNTKLIATELQTINGKVVNKGTVIPINVSVRDTNYNVTYQITNNGENGTPVIKIQIKNPKVTGRYSVELYKVDENGEPIPDNTAYFDVEEKSTEGNSILNTTRAYTNESGIAKAVDGHPIEESTYNIFDITEGKSPSGYNKYNNKITLTVYTKENSSSYVIDKQHSVLNVENVGTIEMSENDGSFGEENDIAWYLDDTQATPVIKIYVKNKHIEGKFNLQLTKVDAVSNTPLQGITFNMLNDRNEVIEPKTTNSNGIILIDSNVKIERKNQLFGYNFEEDVSYVPATHTPIKYHRISVQLKSSVSDDDKSYTITKDDVTLFFIENDNIADNTEEVEKERKLLENATVDVIPGEILTVNITIPNNPQSHYVFSLEKVDSEDENNRIEDARFTIYDVTKRNTYDLILGDSVLEHNNERGIWVDVKDNVEIGKTYKYRITEEYVPAPYRNVYKKFPIEVEIYLAENGKVDLSRSSARVLNPNNIIESDEDYIFAQECLGELVFDGEHGAATNSVKLIIKNPKQTKDFSLELYKHEIGDEEKEVEGAKFDFEKRTQNTNYSHFRLPIETSKGVLEEIDRVNGAYYGTEYYYKVEETNLPTNFVGKIKQAIVKIAVSNSGDVTGEITHVTGTDNNQVIYDEAAHGKYIKLDREDNKFILKFANSTVYRLQLIKRKDNPNYDGNIEGYEVKTDGLFKIEKVNRTDGNVSTETVYEGTPTQIITNDEVNTNSIYEYYITENTAPAGLNNDFENVRVHVTIKTDGNGNVLGADAINGSSIDFETISGDAISNSVKAILYNKCKLKVENNTVTVNMKDSEVVTEPNKYKIKVVKVDKNDPSKVLPGVEFAVRMRTSEYDNIMYDTKSTEPGVQNPITNNNGYILIDQMTLTPNTTDYYTIEEVRGLPEYKALTGLGINVKVDLNGITESSQLTNNNVTLTFDNQNSVDTSEIKANVTKDGIIQIIVPNEPNTFELILNKYDDQENLLIADRKNNTLDGASFDVIESTTDGDIERIAPGVLEEGTISYEAPISANSQYTYIIRENQSKTGYSNKLVGAYIRLVVVIDENGNIKYEKDANDKLIFRDGLTRYEVINPNPHASINIAEAAACVDVKVESGNKVIVDVSNPHDYIINLRKVNTKDGPISDVKMTLARVIDGVEQEKHTMENISAMAVYDIGIQNNEEQTWRLREEKVTIPYYNILENGKYVDIHVKFENNELKVLGYDVYNQDGTNGTIINDTLSVEPVLIGKTYSLNIKVTNPIKYALKIKKVIEKQGGGYVQIPGASLRISQINQLTGQTTQAGAYSSGNGNTVQDIDVVNISKIGQVYVLRIEETKAPINFKNIFAGKYIEVKTYVNEDGTITATDLQVYNSDDTENPIPTSDDIYNYIKIGEVMYTQDSIPYLPFVIMNPYDYKFTITKVKTDINSTPLEGADIIVNDGELRITDNNSSSTKEQTIKVNEEKSYFIRENSTTGNHFNILKNKKVEIKVKLNEQRKLEITAMKVYDKRNEQYFEILGEGAEKILSYVSANVVTDENGKQNVEVKLQNPVQYKVNIMKVKSDNKTDLVGANINVNDVTVIEGNTSRYTETIISKVGESAIFNISEISSPKGYRNVLENRKLAVVTVVDPNENVRITNVTINEGTSFKNLQETDLKDYITVYPPRTDSDGVQVVDIKIQNPRVYNFKVMKTKADGSTLLKGAQIRLNGQTIISGDTSEYELSKEMNIGETFEMVINEDATAQGNVNILKDKILIVNAEITENESINTSMKVVNKDDTTKTAISNDELLKYFDVQYDSNERMLTVKIINPDEYVFKLMKIDKDTMGKLNGVPFDINVKDSNGNDVTLVNSNTLQPINLNNLKTESVNNEHGVIIIPNILLQRTGDYVVTLHEHRINGYISAKDIKVAVKVENVNGNYEVTKAELIEGDIDKDNVKLINAKPEAVAVVAENERIKGSYDLAINKIDKITGKKLDGAEFEVSVEKDNNPFELYKATNNVNDKNVIIPTRVTVKNGIASIQNIRIDSPDEYIIKLKEVTAPDKYVDYKEEIRIKVVTGIENEKYVLKSAELANKYGLVAMKNDSKTIEVTVANEQFDLALRKFITKTVSYEGTEDEKVVELKNREPVYITEKLKNKSSTTAVYNHSKEPVKAGAGDIVYFTLRVYNEGDVPGYAEEIVDHLPEGLEFVNDEFNAKYGWLLDENDKSLRTVRTNYLSRERNSGNAINSFDVSTGKLDYKDIQIKCRITEDVKAKVKLTNIAEITMFVDIKGNTVIDRDSEPRNVNIPQGIDLSEYKTNEITGEVQYIPGQQDDDDFEKIIVEEFDLALRKFITAVTDGNGNKTDVNTRIPTFKIDENGKYVYDHSKDPVLVGNQNVVEYTIRVFNEGTINGYAAEVKDDIPEGLEFIPEDATNREFRWRMLDEKGNEVDEVNKAKYIVTDYLSKEQEKTDKANLLAAFNEEAYKQGTVKEPSYKDVKVAFRVTAADTSKEIIENRAEISKNTDQDGNNIKDKDSTVDVWIDGEDDQDIEKIKVQYFDLSLRKWVTKAIVIQDGKETVTETGHKAEDDPESTVKVDLKKSDIDNLTVKFVYSIRVKNDGTMPGSVEEISDYIPEGLRFDKADNPDWEEKDGKVVTSKFAGQVLEHDETVETEIVLTWINRADNMGRKVNVAEISKDKNKFGSPDIDSVPNNKVPGEDDIDDAPVMITVKTGETVLYVGVAMLVLTILAGGVYLIKKYVIK